MVSRGRKRVLLRFQILHISLSIELGVGGRRIKWYDQNCMEDARKLVQRNWRNAAKNRDSWEKLLNKALAQKGLLCQ